jgi:hypothetical protein
MSQLCDQEVRLAADSSGAGLDQLLPVPVVRLFEQSDDCCIRSGAGEPAYRLEKCPAVETRADEHGLDPLSRKDLGGVGQGGGRPDFEAGTTPFERSARDPALGGVAIGKKKPRRGFIAGEDVYVGRHEGAGAPDGPHPKPDQFLLYGCFCPTNTPDARATQSETRLRCGWLRISTIGPGQRPAMTSALAPCLSKALTTVPFAACPLHPGWAAFCLQSSQREHSVMPRPN